MNNRFPSIFIEKIFVDKKKNGFDKFQEFMMFLWGKMIY